jgi:dTDP-4-amino-4,6-dideoxygalactose transaminase
LNNHLQVNKKNIESPRKRIIGGKFGFPVEIEFHEKPPLFMQGNPVLLSNARSAIKIIIDNINPKNIWLPSFLCKAMVSAVESSNTKINFYPINENLKIISQEFISGIRTHDLFVAVDYFGFKFDRNVIKELKESGVYVLLDFCQALFADWTLNEADYYIYSPRKFFGVPDGGILHSSTINQLEIAELACLPKEIQHHLFSASILRRDYDKSGLGRDWYELFKNGEQTFSASNVAMSEISEFLLRYSFNSQQISQQRIANYLTLLPFLQPYALFPELPNNITPLGFPIKIKNRDEVRQSLFGMDIFPPVHWPIDGVVPEEFYESHLLSSKILTIPCDQRYTCEDMIHLAKNILKVIAS